MLPLASTGVCGLIRLLHANDISIISMNRLINLENPLLHRKWSVFIRSPQGITAKLQKLFGDPIANDMTLDNDSEIEMIRYLYWQAGDHIVVCSTQLLRCPSMEEWEVIKG